MIDRTNLIDTLAEIARENITKFDFAGCGMYNLGLPSNNEYSFRNEGGIIFQIYPYEGEDFYGHSYVLNYYPVEVNGKYPNGEWKDWEHDDIPFNELNDADLSILLNSIEETLKIKFTFDMKDVSLTHFIKKGLTLDDKVKIINAWEEWRCGIEGEAVYDLELDNDFFLFKDLYDKYIADKCKQIGRFWVGGINYYARVCDKAIGCTTPIFNLDDALADNFIENTIDMEERFTELVASHCESGAYTNVMDSYESAIKYATDAFFGLIDFKSFLKATNEDYRNKSSKITYKWYAICTDGSYEETSGSEFKDEESCYKDMRLAVLEKMKWNTEYDEDFEDGDWVTYKVEFSKNTICHHSFSGDYVYRIVRMVNGVSDKSELVKEISSNFGHKEVSRLAYDWDGILTNTQVSMINTTDKVGFTKDGKVALSVFYPNKFTPSYSDDFPLDEMSISMLLGLYATASIKEMDRVNDKLSNL